MTSRIMCVTWALLAILQADAVADPPPSSYVIGDVPVSLTMTAPLPPRFVGDAATIEATALLAGAPPSGGAAVVLALDLSQSMVNHTVPEDACGDANDDGLDDTWLDCQILGAEAVLQRMIALGNVDELAVVIFQEYASAVDLSPATGLQTFVSPDADANSNDVPDVIEVVRTATWYRGAVAS